VRQTDVIELTDTDVAKLPFLTKAAYVYFRRTNSKSHNYIYAKYGEAFTTNLLALLNDMRIGKIEEIWYKIDPVSEVRISRRGSSISGVIYSANHELLKNIENKLLAQRNENKSFRC
jgi:hypothetical protein